MLKILKKHKFTINLILILIFARLIPHPPNFTQVIAAAIMSSFLFKNLKISISVLITSMLITDLFIGFYVNIIFVYISLILIILIFFKFKAKLNFKNLLVASFTGSIVFFLISNFGVWFLGSHGINNVAYDKNFDGLIKCYFYAIPFFKNTLVSTLFFVYSTFLVNSLYYKFKKA